MLSVIIPVYNEEKYIEHCLHSIINQDYDKEDLEVFFIDGLSSDATRRIISDYARQYPYIHLIDNPNRIVPYGMNIGIGMAKGDIIMRLDAHADYQSNYFSTLTSALQTLQADNVGARWRTDVLHHTPKTDAIKEVLCHKFGVGNSAFRIDTGNDDIMEADTVPFGCFRRDVFTRFGLYNTLLVRNQDIELNKRIHAGGGKIYLLPQVLCTYYARETFAGIARNNYLNGLWNLLTVKITKHFSSLSIRHFVPLLFLLSLIIPAICSIAYWPFILISALSLTLYLIFLLITCTNISLRKRRHFGYLCIAFIVLHFSYAAGSLVGIFKSVKK